MGCYTHISSDVLSYSQKEIDIMLFEKQDLIKSYVGVNSMPLSARENTIAVNTLDNKPYIFINKQWLPLTSSTGVTTESDPIYQSEKSTLQTKLDASWKKAPTIVNGDFVELNTPIDIADDEMLEIAITNSVIIADAGNLLLHETLDFMLRNNGNFDLDIETAEHGIEWFIESHITNKALVKLKVGLDSDGSTYETFSHATPNGVDEVLYRKVKVV